MKFDNKSSVWSGVPSPSNQFVGHYKFITNLVHKLCHSDYQSISLEGIPGVGKTAIAIMLAYHPESRSHFTDGVLWAGLGPKSDVSQIQYQWANALGVEISHLPDIYARQDVLKNEIGQRRILIVIDDVWIVDDANIFREAGPNCAYILTTRDRHIARQFSGIQDVHHVPVLPRKISYSLLNKIAPEACVSEPQITHQLNESVGGLPLAIELLGGYLAAPENSMFPESRKKALFQISTSKQRLQLVKKRLGASNNRTETLLAIIELSISSLPLHIQTLFYNLGAFASSPAFFDKAAAEFVLNIDDIALSIMISRNLLSKDSGNQLTLHQVLSDVARTRLQTEAVTRHREYYLNFAKQYEQDWQKIEEVYPQLKQAWNSGQNTSIILEFIYALSSYQRKRGHWQDHLEWSTQALKVARKLKKRLDMTALLSHTGIAYANHGQQQKALLLYQEAFFFARELGDKRNEAIVLNSLGGAYKSFGEPERALYLYERSLSIRRMHGNRAEIATVLNNIGGLYLTLRRSEKAIHYYEQALYLARAEGNLNQESTILNNIAGIHDDNGNKKLALQYYQQELSVAKQRGDIIAESRVLNNIGLVYDSEHNYDDALCAYEQALTLLDHIDTPYMKYILLYNMSQSYKQLGQDTKAHEFYEQSRLMKSQLGDAIHDSRKLNSVNGVSGRLDDKIEFLRGSKQAHRSSNKYKPTLKSLEECQQNLIKKQKSGDLLGQARTLNHIGLIYSNRKDKRRAITFYEKSLKLYKQIGDRKGEGSTLNNIGSAYDRLKEFKLALNYLQEALEIRIALGEHRRECWTRNNIAFVYMHLGQWQDAEEQMKMVVTLDEKYNHPDLEEDRRTLLHIQEHIN
ncbi:MAG: tetratricopeptide repeat protein [Chloroflexota bacterium]